MPAAALISEINASMAPVSASQCRFHFICTGAVRIEAVNHNVCEIDHDAVAGTAGTEVVLETFRGAEPGDVRSLKLAQALAKIRVGTAEFPQVPALRPGSSREVFPHHFERIGVFLLIAIHFEMGTVLPANACGGPFWWQPGKAGVETGCPLIDLFV